jgi:serine/threonine protein kinase
VNRCLQYDSSKRFTWAQIEAHPFFNHKEYYRVLEKVSFAMNVGEDGQSVILQQMPDKVISNFHNSKRLKAPPETPVLENRGIENRRQIKLNVQRDLKKSSHFVQSNNVALA